MNILDNFLFSMAVRLLKRYFSVVSIFSKNDQVKAITFSISKEDIDQQVIEHYFNIINKPDEEN
jgi:hypothetical protein